MVDRNTKLARLLRERQTEAEKALWFRLRNRQLAGMKFKRQVSFPPYVVDFYCAEAKLIVELDGGQHSPETDAERTQWLTERGYRIIRFWNNDVLSNIDGVLESISEVARPD